MSFKEFFISIIYFLITSFKKEIIDFKCYKNYFVSLIDSEKSTKMELKDWVLVKVASSEPIRVPLGGRVELECTVFGSPVPQAQWSRGIQLNQVISTFNIIYFYFS